MTKFIDDLWDTLREICSQQGTFLDGEFVWVNRARLKQALNYLDEKYREEQDMFWEQATTKPSVAPGLAELMETIEMMGVSLTPRGKK